MLFLVQLQQGITISATMTKNNEIISQVRFSRTEDHCSEFCIGIYGWGGVGAGTGRREDVHDDEKKMCDLFLEHIFFGGKRPLFRRKHPILQRNSLFKRETLFILLPKLGGEELPSSR